MSTGKALLPVSFSFTQVLAHFSRHPLLASFGLGLSVLRALSASPQGIEIRDADEPRRRITIEQEEPCEKRP